jgi:hypothetical protein
MQMQSAYTADDFFEEKFTATMSQAEPQSEFNNLLLKALQIVKEVCFAHSVTFFWVKSETRQLVIEGKITDSPAFTSERKLPIGLDIVSAIGMNGQPQMVNNILPETERNILSYYKNLQDIRSFIGVPVFYAGNHPHSRSVCLRWTAKRRMPMVKRRLRCFRMSRN